MHQTDVEEKEPMTYQSPDRPEPNEQQPIRARVPEHVSGGAFSTGVIVMTANTEFVLDFVQNLGRPHQIVARVVMPHHVLPQLVDALQRNIDLYRGRWGELPTAGPTAEKTQPSPATDPMETSSNAHNSPGIPFQAATPDPAVGAGSPAANGPGPGGGPPSSDSSPSAAGGHGVRQASAQEVYDDLKIRDELLSGAYANAVMIGHGPHEFSFDFITNFYPHSAVSARVFLAAGQVPRLYDSLKGTWDQLRSRLKPPGPDQGGMGGNWPGAGNPEDGPNSSQ